MLSWLDLARDRIGLAFTDNQGIVQLEQSANESVSPPFLAAPAVAHLHPRTFLCAWEEYKSGWRVMSQPFDSQGVSQGTNRALDSGADSLLKLTPAVAGDTAGGYLAAWSQGDASRSDIYVRLFDAAHSPRGPAFALTAPGAGESYLFPRVCYVESSNEYQIVYVQTDAPADSTALWLRRLRQDGTAADSARPLAAGPFPWAPQTARSGAGIAIFTERYDNQGEIRSLLLDAAGAIVDSSEVISAAATRERSHIACSDFGDTLAVVWQDRLSGEFDIHGRSRAAGANLGTEQILSTDGPGGQQTDADLCGRLGGGVYVVYADLQNGADIELAEVDETGALLARRRVPDDSLQAVQYDPHIASSSSGYCLITWSDERTDWPGPAVHAACRFAQAGLFVTAAQPLSSSVTGSYQGQTDVAMHSNRNSAAVWIDDRSGVQLAYLRRFNSTGSPAGPEVAQNDGSQSQLVVALERDPVVSIDTTGAIWTVWSALDVITDSFSVLGQAWSASGVRRGGNVNLTPAGLTASPLSFQAAAVGDGSVRLVWVDPQTSTSVWTARFDSLGALVSGPAAVSTGSAGVSDPAVAIDVTGRWTVAWSQAGGAFEDLVWQRFESNNTPTGGTEKISGSAVATRRRGAALAYAGSYLYGAWHDNETSGQGYDVRLSSLLKTTASVDEDRSLRPQSFALGPNVPNPFNGETRIEYRLSRPAQVELSIFDALGRRVITLVDAVQAAGVYDLRWDGRDGKGATLASGVYFYRLVSDLGTDVRKLLYLK
jgi:hypothetical protein